MNILLTNTFYVSLHKHRYCREPMAHPEDNNYKPLVSFVITYFNEPIQMLRECIDSIFHLTLSEEEREIILIDDGSDICPLNEITEYRDKLIYLRQNNRGVSEARNMGIQVSNGRYIQFVDSDDYLITDGYNHCLNMVREHHPDIIVFNSTKEETDADSPNLFEGPVSGASYMRHHNLRASACGYIFSRKILIDLRFTAGIQYGEDEKFTPQLILRAEQLFHTETIAYFYRDNPNSVSNKTSEIAINKRLDDSEHVLLYLDHLAAVLPLNERTALERRVAQLSMDYIYNIIRFTHSSEELEKRLERLHKRGLFPLPDRDYTPKYKLFSKITKYKAGRKLMMMALRFQ